MDASCMIRMHRLQAYNAVPFWQQLLDCLLLNAVPFWQQYIHGVDNATRQTGVGACAIKLKQRMHGPSPIKNRSMRETFHAADISRELLNYHLLWIGDQ